MRHRGGDHRRTSLSGGRGALVGTLLGAIVIGVLGGGLILAVVLDSCRARLSRALG